MDPDTTLVVGMVLAVLSIPAIVSALSEAKAPRIAAIVLIIAGGLMVYAINSKDGGYRIEDVPRVVFTVIARVLP